MKFNEEKKACEDYLKAKQEALLDIEAKLKEERAQFERLDGCNNCAHGDMEARQRVPPRKEKKTTKILCYWTVERFSSALQGM